jgi:dCTP diphosphatase
MDLAKLKLRLQEFAKERDWDQFHSPKNLCMALGSEIGELTELFQWINEEHSKLENLSPKTLNDIKLEIADIFIYLIRIVDKLNIDLEEAVSAKLKLNELKYPVNLSKGNSIKYSRRDV